MSREDLLAMGLTEEQVETIIKDHAKVVQDAKKQASTKAKTDADTIDELQKKLDEINKKNMSDIEKANAEKDDAINTVAELQKQIQQMKIENELAKLGITENLFDENGSVDFAVLGEVISSREKNAVAEYEKKSLEGTPNPDGNGHGDDDDKGKTEAEKVAEALFANGNDAKASSDIINAYA